MGLVFGLAELGLFALFAGTCVMLVLTLLFALVGSIVGLVGLQIDADGDGIVAATVGTMILWGVTLVAGGICSAAGAGGPWNASPFGWLQGVVRSALKPHLAPGPHTWATDYSGMWATFWSFCLVSLLFSLVVVGLFAVYGMLRASRRAASE